MHAFDVAKKLGYESKDSKGICQGFSIRWLEACLAGEEKLFLKRIEKIAEYNNFAEPLLKQVAIVKKRVASWQTSAPDLQHLTEEEQELFDVLAFYESLVLYHRPHNHSLLPEGACQENIEKISPIASSDSILKKGGWQQIYKEAMILTREEIKKYFDELANLLAQHLPPEQQVGLMLANQSHAIALTYQQEAGWTFMDINQYPPKTLGKDTDNLSYYISLAFGYDWHIPLNATLFTTGDHPNLVQFKKDFSTLKFGKNLAEMALRASRDGIDLAYMAAAQGDAAMLSELGKAGANLHKTYKETKHTLAWIAAQNGHINILHELAKNNVDLDKTDTKGVAPVHVAALTGQYEAITVLHQYKIPVNKRNEKNGFTPSHYAAIGGQSKTLDTLKQLGANLNEEADGGVTPLHNAILRQQEHIVVKLLNDKEIDCNKNENGVHPIHYASWAGSDTILDLFKKKGFDLAIEDRDGKTIAHYLAEKGYADLVEKYLEQGFDFNKKDKKGLTPLHCAAKAGQLGIIKLLAEKGFDLNKDDESGQNIAHIAAAHNQAHLIPFLADKGVDLAKKDKGNVTPIMRAAIQGAKEALIKLIPYDSEDLIPYLAILRDQITIIETLFELKIPFKDTAFCNYSAVKAKLIAEGSAKTQARIEDFLAQKEDKENPSITAYEFAFLLGKDDILRLLNQHDPKTRELLRSLQVLRAHGEAIKQKNLKNEVEGEKAIAAADALENLAYLYFAEKNTLNPDTKTIEKIQDSFKQRLAQTHKDLSTHRSLWKPVLANILIAATGIGLLVIIGKLLITGNAFFMETKRQKLANEVSGEFEKLLANKPT
ncbi:ankyrin repeat domain-containing protein [Legionella septentrionalis]|uniref:ankyrin repeat domain-containing protein n=1 Tax=Legionella septentrionalis TaxID=2498109 RepID=UPI001315710D|nr:ankyrin repeat domain-containing protein [Legionella septentrionalis]